MCMWSQTLITDSGRSHYHSSGKGGSCPIIWLWFCCACIFWSCIMAWSRWYRLRMAWSVRPGSRCAIWYLRWRAGGQA